MQSALALTTALSREALLLRMLSSIQRNLRGAHVDPARRTECTQEALESRARLTRLAQRLMHSALVGAFTRWWDVRAEAKATLVLVTRHIKNMHNYALAGAISRWVGMVHKVANTRHAVQRALQRTKRRALVQTYKAWVETGRRIRRGRAVFVAALSNASATSLHRHILCFWASYASRTVLLRRRLRCHCERRGTTRIRTRRTYDPEPYTLNPKP